MQCRGPYGGRRAGWRAVLCHEHGRAGALRVQRAEQTATRSQDHERSGRRFQYRERAAGHAGTLASGIAIPNDRLLTLVPRETSFFESFKVADDLLRQAVQGISDIIITPGLINRDFSDIKATMVGMGYAMMGTAIGRGENAAVEAARQAISCPLLEDSRISGSRGILINITGSSTLGLHEVNEACSIIRDAAECDDVQMNLGMILNDSLEDSVKITVIATGFQPPHLQMPEVRGPVT